MSSPKIAFIIPTLNEASVIGELLQSLQTYRRHGHKVLVVDGGSCDMTAQVAQPLADKVIMAKRGRAHQMNAGATIASEQILAFVHADTRLPADADRLLLEATKEQQDSWGRFDIKLSGKGWPLRIIERSMNWRSRLTGIATGDQAIFVTRALFDEIGGYPEIGLMEDIALCRALKRKSGPLCLPQKAISSSRKWETDGVWQTVWLMWRLRLTYLLGADPRRLAARYYPQDP